MAVAIVDLLKGFDMDKNIEWRGDLLSRHLKSLCVKKVEYEIAATINLNLSILIELFADLLRIKVMTQRAKKVD
ncbi:MAG: hypothetical protein J0M35_17745 [Candidatus Obscuribacter phosphatis]|uniref:Uncharacterized protein n=1 Tax=Candidatus Obscuribacter phosphatis TaxID=1906157 RepID=A0A8J7PIY3_9BACT|nr:hypothetical protein [Candidatus Obscuribacter phosphatis]